MIRDFNIAPDAMINPSKIMGGGIGGVSGGLIAPAETYYVDRNTGSSGDGKSLANAFLTIGEAIAQVNADYSAGANNVKSKGRMRRIVVGEGWYSEVPLRLTANDVHIVGNAPGNHDQIVLYGSGTAGGWDGSAGGPALTLEGSNCTIENMGFFTYDTGYYALQSGRHNGDALGRKAVVGNSIINCNFVRDRFQASAGGILSYCMEALLVQGCFFGTSCLTNGIAVNTDGVINPVNPRIIGNRFIGTDCGVYSDTTISGWLILHNVFMDDITDRANAIVNPLNITGSGVAAFNLTPDSTGAEFNAGGTLHELFNYGSDLTFWT